ncbi:MAG: hypothetical protein QM804_16320 [Propionicimonas sp.]
MTDALRSLVRETSALLGRTGGVWAGLWWPLISLALLGWVAYYGSVLLGVTIAPIQPYLIVPTLAAGAVVQLATIVAGMRRVAGELRVADLLAREADAAVPASELAVLGATLLPFLGIYSAFGMVDRYATDLMTVVVIRHGEGAVVGDLNPTKEWWGIAVVVGVVIVLFGVRRWLESVQERTGRGWPGLVGVFVEASALFLVLLSGFRVAESVQLWWHDTTAASWLDAPLAWLADWWMAMPQPVAVVGDFLAATLWPLVWEVVTQPLAWLTLAALAYGSRVVSLADLWRGRPPAAAPDARPAASGRLRTVVLEVQQVVLGDLDGKYLPTWHSLRLVLRAGAPFLGAFILVFTVLRITSDALSNLLRDLIGPQQITVWIKLLPFEELIPTVLTMSLQLALLGAAFSRILAGASDPRPTDRSGRAQRAVVVSLLCLALAGASVLNDRATSDVQRDGQVGVTTAFMGASVTVGQPRVGDVLVREGSDPLRSAGSFVVVPVSVYRGGDGLQSVTVALVAGDRRYDPWPGGSLSVATAPGFETTGEFLFEVLADDLPRLTLLVTPDEGMLRGTGVTLRVSPRLAATAGTVQLQGSAVERVP